MYSEYVTYDQCFSLLLRRPSSGMVLLGRQSSAWLGKQCWPGHHMISALSSDLSHVWWRERDHSLVAHAFMHVSLNGRMSTGFACLEVYPVPITFLAMVHLTGWFSFWRLKLVVSSCSLPPLPSEAPSVTHVNYALYSSTSLTRNLHDKQELMDWPHGPLRCCLWLPVPLLLDRHPKIIIVVFALISLHRPL